MEHQNFWFIFGIGALLVVGTSIEKYAMADYHKDNGRLHMNFVPRLITSEAKYFVSLAVYLFLILGLYSYVSIAEGGVALAKVFNIKVEIVELGFPLLVASAIMGAQNAKYLKKLELMFRIFCQRLAKVPYGVDRLVDQLLHKPVDFSQYRNIDLNNRREFQHVRFADFDQEYDTTEEKWARICCILYSLNLTVEGGGLQNGFLPNEFDSKLASTYSKEYENLNRLHRGLGNSVEIFRLIPTCKKIDSLVFC